MWKVSKTSCSNWVVWGCRKHLTSPCRGLILWDVFMFASDHHHTFLRVELHDRNSFNYSRLEYCVISPLIDSATAGADESITVPCCETFLPGVDDKDWAQKRQLCMGRRGFRLSVLLNLNIAFRLERRPKLIILTSSLFSPVSHHVFGRRRRSVFVLEVILRCRW